MVRLLGAALKMLAAVVVRRLVAQERAEMREVPAVRVGWRRARRGGSCHLRRRQANVLKRWQLNLRQKQKGSRGVSSVLVLNGFYCLAR